MLGRNPDRSSYRATGARGDTSRQSWTNAKRNCPLLCAFTDTKCTHTTPRASPFSGSSYPVYFHCNEKIFKRRQGWPVDHTCLSRRTRASLWQGDVWPELEQRRPSGGEACWDTGPKGAHTVGGLEREHNGKGACLSHG